MAKDDDKKTPADGEGDLLTEMEEHYQEGRMDKALLAIESANDEAGVSDSPSSPPA